MEDTLDLRHIVSDADSLMNTSTTSNYCDHSQDTCCDSYISEPVPPNPFWWKQYVNNRTNKKKNKRNKKSKK